VTTTAAARLRRRYMEIPNYIVFGIEHGVTEFDQLNAQKGPADAPGKTVGTLGVPVARSIAETGLTKPKTAFKSSTLFSEDSMPRKSDILVDCDILALEDDDDDDEADDDSDTAILVQTWTVALALSRTHKRSQFCSRWQTDLPRRAFIAQWVQHAPLPHAPSVLPTLDRDHRGRRSYATAASSARRRLTVIA
jgi:hypothetical protein